MNSYEYDFDTCAVTTEPGKIVELKNVCRTAILNYITYWGVEKSTGIPWPVVAAIHYRESSQSFSCHMHNGDPLIARTVHVPKGRPAHSEPPFTWTQSAIDAFSEVWRPRTWSVGSVLEFCERYNGLGYERRELMSPYVWSFTDKYTTGLFVADGSFDPTKKDSRPGCAAILKTLSMWGEISLDFSQDNPENSTIH